MAIKHASLQAAETTMTAPGEPHEEPAEATGAASMICDEAEESAMPSFLPATGAARATLSAPLGPDGQSVRAAVQLEAGERLIGVRVEREAQVYVSDRGRAFAVAVDGTVTIREED